MQQTTAIYVNTLFVLSYFGAVWFSHKRDHGPMLICLVGAGLIAVFIIVTSRE